MEFKYQVFILLRSEWRRKREANTFYDILILHEVTNCMPATKRWLKLVLFLISVETLMIGVFVVGKRKVHILLCLLFCY